jgi:alanine-synthesizing transaminase
MFSKRTHWNFTPNALTLAIARMQRQGVAYDDLTESNPTRVGLSLPYGAAYEALASTTTAHYHPDAHGALNAREAVRDYYTKRSVDVSVEQLFLTASTSEAYGWIFKLLCDPGDDVLVAHPSYPLFDDLARMENVTLQPFPLSYTTRWQLDLDALQRAITPRSRAMVLVHPNNPTGSFIARDVLDGLCAICEKHGLALVVDEVFFDYGYQPDALRAGSFANVNKVLTFTLSGLSKVVALPQMKLGWIVVNGPSELTQTAIERLENIADSYLSPGASVLQAVKGFLDCCEDVQIRIRSRVVKHRAMIREAMGEHSRATLLQAEGGWYATLRVARTRTEEEWAIVLLEEERVLVHPGWFFDFEREAYLVISLLPDTDVFYPAIRRLLKRIEEDLKPGSKTRCKRILCVGCEVVRQRRTSVKCITVGDIVAILDAKLRVIHGGKFEGSRV